MKINQVINRPILTEKSTSLLKNNFYMFKVDKNANKYQIKAALEKLYPVKVAEVKVVNRQGKVRKVGRKQVKKQLSTKKIAFIKLKEGKIELFPQA
ncbi:50S ribosomal protein L23 [Candidatus Roizmanbacteria bacterium CG02_land_8_20_14_3_00_36_15]|uniref:Large ribosomal subunit protein uL23 n=2 Tax=Candidatus Roizmaniibacteriota TaxID=1752723 RepID=A0A2M8KLQ9_9BACT|nr:MAG: 50S ribosomal protein L23 [Candidatus Roizmanbacteria bacterium CG03_land_8_20_14_0_80_36_21]PIV37897.1 MAG: 50S ribosomal protein L23 [Candidatus Roizmanbacteria bacterium CG02_land_8_20_14_3_00_36_15]PIY69867.1 MAG: 50S ribosomal protein L23 [Candidatus Roizmanbacteria bacterium CG_4_10_14_0_8_um_filter_36_36]PJA53873.1 MAG: 50S ribosomal protein L23 [Candidatus Roizmanbacteria bacterium CG_4_9_14_3_um_filter_36_11]PJC81705.1 MAG: 50S ribosomal protein L23 [Candidatus Roizmanbacteria 